MFFVIHFFSASVDSENTISNTIKYYQILSNTTITTITKITSKTRYRYTNADYGIVLFCVAIGCIILGLIYIFWYCIKK